ncbi:MarR family winged helix-turn-helix transcriptional regulator [Rathayibacter iranicus]|uniref:MarR family transcriptional regulator n=2 Tax=Rathayibacter iranicus TaxID=59737 RepID=A0AAD1ENM6_9MICO|nr:MarR family transcriptional regulator [Rathayibacter iranicus]AZZ56955.1 MarR family transcriptional regulator [Rathayibacter iranicus]MWV29556.1 MarR family transcriptional regulator [Rathayibacter iranicus NCPPB 2253 = VKM Ac-1602]PPI41879.1 MarR family transcriptional regulator [Rathayibacter iranicus]PPI57619.1 MarR family transcriptional regulator [Rathayibacter iranicus]PPI68599.1 MarR family transcriptional regulator [Rathayibacter iranicus]
MRVDDSSAMEGWPTGRLLSTASRMVEHARHGALAEIGLTHAGLIVLHLLHAGPVAQKQLAAAAHVEVQTMSRTLERLEREGHVTRTTDPADRRRQLVSLTSAGRAAWRRAHRLEVDLFPGSREDGPLREALLEIIRSARVARWG